MCEHGQKGNVERAKRNGRVNIPVYSFPKADIRLKSLKVFSLLSGLKLAMLSESVFDSLSLASNIALQTRR